MPPQPNHEQVVFPTSAELVVQIEHPTALEWTIDNHQRKFPLAFKAMVVAMMQCHYRYQQQGSEYDHSAAIALRSAVRFFFSLSLFFECPLLTCLRSPASP